MHESSNLSVDRTLAQRSRYVHWIRERVRWSDTDMAGHANNLAFAAFCETGRAHFLRKFMDRHARSRALFVLGEMRLRFLREAHWPSEIDVGTRVIGIGTRSCRMGQGLFDGDQCIAISEATLVLIDETRRRSRVITPAIREWLSGCRQKPHTTSLD
jgi:acyl-CoA thioester hydrolase